MATTNLGLKTFGHDEPIDFNDWNDNLVNIDTAVGEAKRGKAAYNLLDNSNFRDAVNQRGNTSYSGNGYSIDRWQAELAGGATFTISVSSDKVTISKTGGVCRFYQKLPKSMEGKTVTYSIKTGDGIFSGTCTVSAASQDVKIGNHAAYLSVYQGSGKPIFSIFFYDSSDDTIDVYWAALYEGAYTADTLPEYVPKGYAAELAECQWYFERLGVADSEILGTVAFAKSGAKSVIISMQYQPKRISRPTLSFSDVSKYRLLLMDAVNASVFGASPISGFDEITVQSPFASVRVTMPTPLDRDCWVRLQREDGSDGAYIDVDAGL